jgi:Tfp pilus assembly protein PilF
MIAQKENDCATALTHYTKSIQLHPLHVASYNNMGACALQMGHRTKAVDYLHKACELDPTNEGAKRNLKQALGQ